MNSKEWAETIKELTKQAGTYKPFYDTVIGELAQILEIRDDAVDTYRKSGGSPIVKYTNKGGFTNPRKNPALAIIMEQNQLALSYWRDLGLTPKGFKDVQDIVEQPKQEAKLVSIVGKSKWKKQA